MKHTLLALFLASTWSVAGYAQAVYVDSKTGSDNNPGTEALPVYSIARAADIVKSRGNDIYTMKINPGIYVLDHHISVATDKEMAGKRLIIEASVLPDDTAWTPEKMPVIVSRALKGEIPDGPHFVASFLVNASRVTIRGLKFHGYFYPHTRYFPIARFNRKTTNLSVEQCLFVGDANVSTIQAGVIAHGNGVRIDHCVFYKLRNTVVFFLDSADGSKTGNGITNSIIYGASHAVWTAFPDRDFVFGNNIVANCRYVWVKSPLNPSKYTISNCILVDNQHYKGVPDSVRLKPGDFQIAESNVIREGKISLRETGATDTPTLDEVDRPLPKDYLHVIPGTLGYEKGAGIFKTAGTRISGLGTRMEH